MLKDHTLLYLFYIANTHTIKHTKWIIPVSIINSNTSDNFAKHTRTWTDQKHQSQTDKSHLTE